MQVPALVTRPAGTALAAAFARLAARRGGAGVHTAGLPLSGTLDLRARVPVPGVPLLDRPGVRTDLEFLSPEALIHGLPERLQSIQHGVSDVSESVARRYFGSSALVGWSREETEWATAGGTE